MPLQNRQQYSLYEPHPGPETFLILQQFAVVYSDFRLSTSFNTVEILDMSLHKLLGRDLSITCVESVGLAADLFYNWLRRLPTIRRLSSCCDLPNTMTHLMSIISPGESKRRHRGIVVAKDRHVEARSQPPVVWSASMEWPATQRQKKSIEGAVDSALILGFGGRLVASLPDTTDFTIQLRQHLLRH